MRRLALIAILLLAATALDAVSTTAMIRGDAVLTVSDSSYAFSHNPAALAGELFALDIPVNATLYNFTPVIRNDIVENITDLASMDRERMLNGLLDILRSFNGEMPLLELDERLSLVTGGFGLDARLWQAVLTKGGSIGTQLALTAGGSLSYGLGLKLPFAHCSLSVGYTQEFSFSILSEDIGAHTVVGIMLDEERLENLASWQEWSVSSDLGFLAELPLGFKAALVLRDLGAWREKTGSDGSVEAGLIAPGIDTAIGWSGKWSILTLDLELGLRDVTGLRDSISWMKSLNAGAQLAITKAFSLSTGINGGYPSIGLAFDLLCFDIAIGWWWQDYGVSYGLAPRDILSIELGISF